MSKESARPNDKKAKKVTSVNDQFKPVIDVIPHRPPFLFLDQITKLTATTVVGNYRFESEAFFKGHFPNNPIVPGVILIEGLAQTLAYLALTQVKDGTVLLTGIDNCKVRSPVRPGETVEYTVEVQKAKMGLVRASGRVSVADRRILTAELKGFIDS